MQMHKGQGWSCKGWKGEKQARIHRLKRIVSGTAHMYSVLTLFEVTKGDTSQTGRVEARGPCSGTPCPPKAGRCVGKSLRCCYCSCPVITPDSFSARSVCGGGARSFQYPVRDPAATCNKMERGERQRESQKWHNSLPTFSIFAGGFANVVQVEEGERQPYVIR